MFSNIGAKIKTVAVGLCWVGIILSCIYAIILWSQNSYRQPTVATGFFVLIFGCVGSWIGSFITYGFGELIDETIASHQTAQRTNLLLEKLITLQEKETADQAVAAAKKPVTAHTLSTHRWACPQCGEMIDKYPCPHCASTK